MGNMVLRLPCAKGAPAVAGEGLCETLLQSLRLTSVRHLPLHKGGVWKLQILQIRVPKERPRSHREAAVHAKALPRDEVGLVGKEEAGGVEHVLGGADAPHGGVIDERCARFLV